MDHPEPEHASSPTAEELLDQLEHVADAVLHADKDEVRKAVQVEADTLVERSLTTVDKYAKDAKKYINELDIDSKLKEQLLKLHHLVMATVKKDENMTAVNSEVDKVKAMVNNLLDRLNQVIDEVEMAADASHLHDHARDIAYELKIIVAQLTASDDARESLESLRGLLQIVLENDNFKKLMAFGQEETTKYVNSKAEQGAALLEEAPVHVKSVETWLRDDQVEDLAKTFELLLFFGDREEVVAPIIADPYWKRVHEFLEMCRQYSNNAIRIKTSDSNELVKVLIPLLASKMEEVAVHLKHVREEKIAVEWVEKNLKFLTKERESLVEETLQDLDTEALIKRIDQTSTDTKGRSKLVNEIKDFALQYITTSLPELEVPAIEGEKDGVQYTVKNLDLSGIKVDKDALKVEIKPFHEVKNGDPFLLLTLSNVSATINDLEWSFQQTYFPFMTGDGTASATVQGLDIMLGFQIYRARPVDEQTQGEDEPQNETADGDSGDPIAKPPTPKTGAAMRHPSIFKVDENEYQPRISACFTNVDIKNIELSISGHWLSFLYNTMSDLFNDNIKQYLISLIQDSMFEHVDGWVQWFNKQIMDNWAGMCAVLEFDLTGLPTATDAERKATEFLSGLIEQSKRQDLYQVTFRKLGPIGIEFEQQGAYVVVGGFRRTKSGQLLPAEKSGLIRKGDILESFNGQHATSLPLTRVVLRIRACRRPLTLTFRPGSGGERQSTVDGRREPIDCTFADDKLHMLIKPTSAQLAAQVSGFRKLKNGQMGPAEACGRIPVGAILAGVNGKTMTCLSFDETLEVFASTKERPINLRFFANPDFEVTFTEELPTDLKLGAFADGDVIVTGFQHIQGPAELQCKDRLEKGFIVKAVNGTNVEALPFKQVIAALKQAKRPLGIGFGPSESEAPVACAAKFGDGPLGLIFYKSEGNQASFKAFSQFPGPAKRTGQLFPGAAILSVNNEKYQDEIDTMNAILSSSLPLTLQLRDMELYNKLFTQKT